MPDGDRVSPASIDAVRRFTRFYTRRLGVLKERLLDSAFALTEARLLWELAHRDDLTASLLARELELDLGYVSRILGSFAKRGLIEKRRALDDGRKALIRLTEHGRGAFAPLDAASREEVTALLLGLTRAEQARLLEAMRTIEGLLERETPAREGRASA